ncbi:MAG TPA: hypothetical protein ENI61_01095 [Ignavibacteria bacterium]|nr:hypothetical protein [Ignavibacteria bacterium]
MFQVTKEKKLKNGDWRIEYKVTREFEELTKRHYGKKRFSVKLGNQIIIDALYNMSRLELDKNYKKALKMNGLK